MGKINEADWRAFRKLREVALERFYTRTLDEIVARCRGTDCTAEQRYHDVFNHIHDRNEALASVFDNPRRSQMLLHLLSMVSLRLVSKEELAVFSDEVQARVAWVNEDNST